MLKITQQEVMDNIIKNLFKTKRKTPKEISFDKSHLLIIWKNNKTTQVGCFVNIQLKTSEYDGHLFIRIDMNPYCEYRNKYHHTVIDFDIENDVCVWNP